jgi:hypothetical protein
MKTPWCRRGSDQVEGSVADLPAMVVAAGDPFDMSRTSTLGHGDARE